MNVNFHQQWYTLSFGVQLHNKRKITLLSTMFRKLIIRWEWVPLLVCFHFLKVSTKGDQIRVTGVTVSNLYKIHLFLKSACYNAYSFIIVSSVLCHQHIGNYILEKQVSLRSIYTGSIRHWQMDIHFIHWFCS